jgi:gliding motility-associated lipoprotein GldJ
MNTRNFFRLVAGTLVCLLVFASCKKETSSTTGWAYNDPKNGGFEKAKYQNQITGPGLVFIEGGRFTMGRVEEDVMKDWDNYPRTVTVTSFYMDECEVTNFAYCEYLYWLSRVFIPADLQSVYDVALPDTTVWRKRLGWHEPMVEQYLRHPAWRDYPVVGVSWTQAARYCAWRTDRVNEQILIDYGYIKMTNEPTAEGYFNTDAYYIYSDYEQHADPKNRPQYILTKEPRSATMSDGILLPRYRLPTEAEWEFAALGLVGNTLQERILERRTYPWNGQVTRTDDKKYMGKIVMNTRRGRGDFMGVAGALNDEADYTNKSISYWPNDYGLYNMAGNVAEWVMDVYRQLTPEDAEEHNPVRTNIYQTYKTLDDGTIEERDEQGVVPMVPVSDFKNDRRRNYRSANNINYLDGDYASNIDQDVWKDKAVAASTKVMYDKRKEGYPLGSWSMVADNARVYKGGSWADIQYWASPGMRRWLDQNEATDFIGFRCAMDRVGPTNGKGN